jgi:hypothetical protein
MQELDKKRWSITLQPDCSARVPITLVVQFPFGQPELATPTPDNRGELKSTSGQDLVTENRGMTLRNRSQ